MCLRPDCRRNKARIEGIGQALDLTAPGMRVGAYRSFVDRILYFPLGPVVGFAIRM